jgi:hypothetical protein
MIMRSDSHGWWLERKTFEVQDSNATWPFDRSGGNGTKQPVYLYADGISLFQCKTDFLDVKRALEAFVHP